MIIIRIRKILASLLFLSTIFHFQVVAQEDSTCISLTSKIKNLNEKSSEATYKTFFNNIIRCNGHQISNSEADNLICIWTTKFYGFLCYNVQQFVGNGIRFNESRKIFELKASVNDLLKKDLSYNLTCRDIISEFACKKIIDSLNNLLSDYLIMGSFINEVKSYTENEFYDSLRSVKYDLQCSAWSMLAIKIKNYNIQKSLKSISISLIQLKKEEKKSKMEQSDKYMCNCNCEREHVSYPAYIDRCKKIKASKIVDFKRDFKKHKDRVKLYTIYYAYNTDTTQTYLNANRFFADCGENFGPNEIEVHSTENTVTESLIRHKELDVKYGYYFANNCYIDSLNCNIIFQGSVYYSRLCDSIKHTFWDKDYGDTLKKIDNEITEKKYLSPNILSHYNSIIENALECSINGNNEVRKNYVATLRHKLAVIKETLDKAQINSQTKLETNNKKEKK